MKNVETLTYKHCHDSEYSVFGKHRSLSLGSNTSLQRGEVNHLLSATWKVDFLAQGYRLSEILDTDADAVTS